MEREDYDIPPPYLGLDATVFAARIFSSAAAAVVRTSLSLSANRHRNAGPAGAAGGPMALRARAASWRTSELWSASAAVSTGSASWFRRSIFQRARAART